MDGLQPEVIIELAVVREEGLWRDLGFPTAPAPQQRLPSGRRPDLLAAGLVGEAKRLLGPHGGPEQIEAYIDELDAVRPQDGPWRGVLLQTVDHMDANTEKRIAESHHNIEAWAIIRAPTGDWAATRLV